MKYHFPSLAYPLPTYEGIPGWFLILLAVCPFSSLMEDQVKYLTENGISAAYQSTDTNIAADLVLYLDHPNCFMGTKNKEKCAEGSWWLLMKCTPLK